MMRLLLGLVLGLVLGGPALAEERPPPDGPWRPHTLARCIRPSPPVPAARVVLDEARELFELENGGDAVVVLEAGLDRLPTSTWIRFFLAQIYVLAGQGEPHCLPTGGPARPTGDWPSDRRRCLERADELLRRLPADWLDDGVVWFLRADVARALDEPGRAGELDLQGRRCCTRQETLEFLTDLRDLTRKPAELLTAIVPEYPEECIRRRIEGRIELDLLIDPQGRMADWRPRRRGDRRLQEAAASAAAEAGFQAARVGYYPVWSWIEIAVDFSLDRDGAHAD